MKRRKLFFLGLISAVIFSGCTKPQPIEIVYEKPIITVINDSGTDIEIYAKECTQEDSKYEKKALLHTFITAKRHSSKEYKVILNLEEKCYDLKAISIESGLVIGIQKNMSIPPEVRWVLK